MKIHFLMPIMLSLFLGYFCANYVLSEYNSELLLIDNEVYFLQVGAYNNYESSKSDLKDIKNKITLKEEDKYYSYIGMTSNYNQAEKIRKIYKDEKKIDVYIKKNRVDNNEFLNQLLQYDILLSNCSSIDEINSVLNTIIASYEENLLNA